MKSSRLGKEAEEEFKRIDEGFEGDQNEMTFKRSRRAKKENESEDDTPVPFRILLHCRWKKRLVTVCDACLLSPIAEDEVDGGTFSDDSDHERELPNEPNEVDTIWSGENLDDSEDEKEKDKDKDMVLDHLSESESESDESDMSESDEAVVENDDIEKEKLVTIVGLDERLIDCSCMTCLEEMEIASVLTRCLL